MLVGVASSRMCRMTLSWIGNEKPSARRLSIFRVRPPFLFHHVRFLPADLIHLAFLFLDIDLSLIPNVLPTIASPKQAGYRTKITPHFRSLPRQIRETILKEKGIPPPSKKRGKAVVPTFDADEESAINGLDEPTEADPVEAVGGKAEKEGESGGAELQQLEKESKSNKAQGPAGHGEGGRFFSNCGMVDRNGKPAEGDFEFKIGFDERISKRVMDIEVSSRSS